MDALGSAGPSVERTLSARSSAAVTVVGTSKKRLHDAEPSTGTPIAPSQLQRMPRLSHPRPLDTTPA